MLSKNSKFRRKSKIKKIYYRDTDKFLTILDHETDSYFKSIFNQAADQIRNVTELMHSKKPQNVSKVAFKCNDGQNAKN